MSRGVRWVLIGSAALLVLAGCGRNWFAEREPWRREAEEQCLKSGAVREGPNVAMVRSIDGPGVCGADFPLRVAALGESRVLGYGDELRPPGSIPQGTMTRPPPGYPPNTPFAVNPAYPADTRLPPNPDYRDGAPYSGGSYGGARGGDPVSLSPPGVEPPGRDGPGVYVPPSPSYGAPRTMPSRNGIESSTLGRPQGVGYPSSGVPHSYPAPERRSSYPAMTRPSMTPAPTVPMAPSRVPPATGSVSATVTPNATLACPIVSALDRWVADAVQPAALRWFAQPVTEIKQISAYSCRGMNGQPGARISEHAFGNALDISAFKLASGHVVTVKDGWRGTPEEQGFLHDVQLAACEQFTTVLAPGSNAFHYDHIHVDLMRRSSGRAICQPAAVPGEVAAARARGRYAARNRGEEPSITGSISAYRAPRPATRILPDHAGDTTADHRLPRAIPGED